MLALTACDDPAPVRTPAAPHVPASATSVTASAPASQTCIVESVQWAVDRDASAVRAIDLTLQFDRLPTFHDASSSTARRRDAPELLARFERSRARADVQEEYAIEGSPIRMRLTAERDGSLALTWDTSAAVPTPNVVHAYALPDPNRVVVHVGLTRSASGASAPLVHDLHVVVLDPGHGGDDHGAPAGDLRESTLVLDIARRVRARLLERLPSTRVLMTREDDTFVSLAQRAAMANAANADLFISIHLNASPTEAERGGVTTFVLDTSGDRQAIRLAAVENGTSEREVSDLGALVASIERRDQVAEARMLASRVHFATLSAARRQVPNLYDRGVRSAPFSVLVGARMPAILIEASFLLRAPEAPLLRRTEYRDALADGIAQGIVRHAEGR